MKQSVVPGARRIIFWGMPDRFGFTSVDFNIRILRTDRSFFKSCTIICLRFEHGNEYRNRTLKAGIKDVRGKKRKVSSFWQEMISFGQHKI